LRCGLKPEGGKFEGFNQATINEVNYFTTIDGITS